MVSWMLQGWGPLICTARGRPAAAASLLSCALPASACPGGECRILGCVCLAPWHLEPVLLGIALPGPQFHLRFKQLSGERPTIRTPKT